MAWGGGVGRVHSIFMHGRSGMTIEPRILAMPERSMSGFPRPGRRCLHQARSAVRCSASRMRMSCIPPIKNRLRGGLAYGWQLQWVGLISGGGHSNARLWGGLACGWQLQWIRLISGGGHSQRQQCSLVRRTCVWMTASMSSFDFRWWPLPETAMGVQCNCLVGALPRTLHVVRQFPLCGVEVLRPAQMI